MKISVTVRPGVGKEEGETNDSLYSSEAYVWDSAVRGRGHLISALVICRKGQFVIAQKIEKKGNWHFRNCPSQLDARRKGTDDGTSNWHRTNYWKSLKSLTSLIKVGKCFKSSKASFLCI